MKRSKRSTGQTVMPKTSADERLPRRLFAIAATAKLRAHPLDRIHENALEERVFDTLISPEELKAFVGAVLLLDARTGPDARERYAKRHVSGAHFVDLESDMADVGDAKLGGRHPLPAPKDWARVLARLGANSETQMVVYDDKAGANAAARAWWMTRAIGHRRVAVLDGGYTEESAQLLGTDALDPRLDTSTSAFTSSVGDAFVLPTSTLEDVERATQTKSHVVIDVRDAPRYRGEVEPIDPVKGHIPGAVNVPLARNLEANGRFKSPAALRELYSNLLSGNSGSNLIVHCGSGVTACHTLLALERAGMSGASLYVGSFSEWCRNRSVATGV